MTKRLGRISADVLRSSVLPSAVFAATFGGLSLLVTGEPIIADGLENLASACNVLVHHTFSSALAPPVLPDMLREPLWPGLTAGVLYASQVLGGVRNQTVAAVAVDQARLLQLVNCGVLAAFVATLFVAVKARARSLWWGGAAALLGGIVVAGMPRLINKYNNDPLAILSLLAASLAFSRAQRAPRRSSMLMSGLTLGLLALTKAQFLFLAFVPLSFLVWKERRAGGAAALVFLLTVAPWIVRNQLLFEQWGIAERGKTVAATRAVLTIEPARNEYACMFYAFSHPSLRPWIGGLLSIEDAHFERGGRCQRLNRELCFDMGTTSQKVQCAPFPEDQAGRSFRDKVQYFFRGYTAGKEMERGRLTFSEVAPLDFDAAAKYVVTFPLFFWRGLSFGGGPLLAIGLSFALFALLRSNDWPVAVLPVASHLFHVALTHNIPRYHVVELGPMICGAIWLLHRTHAAVRRLLELQRHNQSTG